MDPPPPLPHNLQDRHQILLISKANQRDYHQTVDLWCFGTFFIVTRGKPMLAFVYGVLHDLHSTPKFCKTLLSLPGARPVYELNVYQVALAPTHILSIPPIKLPCACLTSPLSIRHIPIALSLLRPHLARLLPRREVSPRQPKLFKSCDYLQAF